VAQMQYIGAWTKCSKQQEEGELHLDWLFETICKELAYHSRGFRSAFQVGWPREPRATFEGLSVAIFLGLVNRFALRADDDDRFNGIAVPRHFQ